MTDGFVARYATTPSVDGLPPGEGAFLACTFWLADNYMLQGREADARPAFSKRLLDIRNDLGLLAEEYDPRRGACWATFRKRFARWLGQHGLQHLPGRRARRTSLPRLTRLPRAQEPLHGFA